VLSRPLGHSYFLAPAPIVNLRPLRHSLIQRNVAEVIDSPPAAISSASPLQVSPAPVWSSLPGSPVVTTRKMHQPSIAYRNLA